MSQAPFQFRPHGGEIGFLVGLAPDHDMIDAGNAVPGQSVGEQRPKAALHAIARLSRLLIYFATTR